MQFYHLSFLDQETVDKFEKRNGKMIKDNSIKVPILAEIW